MNGFEPMSLVLLKCQIVEEKDLINNFFLRLAKSRTNEPQFVLDISQTKQN